MELLRKRNSSLRPERTSITSVCCVRVATLGLTLSRSFETIHVVSTKAPQFVRHEKKVDIHPLA